MSIDCDQVLERKCNRCGEIKKESEFGKSKTECRSCKKIRDREYYIKNKDKITIQSKKYKEIFKQTHPNYFKDYYKENQETKLRYAKQYRESNREILNEKQKKYQLINKDTCSIYYKQYYQNNKDIRLKNALEWGSVNKERKNLRQREYMQTYAGKMATARHEFKRRVLGFDPINQKFEGSEFHHLHINGCKKLGLFIPASLHQSIKHNGNTGKNMAEINAMAIEWFVSNMCIRANYLKYELEIRGFPEHIRRLLK